MLADLGIKLPLKSWSIDPYRSKYYSDYAEEEDWRDRWPIVWLVRVATVSEIGAIPKLKGQSIGTNAAGTGRWEGPGDDDAVGCLVVADFPDGESLKSAVTAIGKGENDKVSRSLLHR